MNSKFNKNNLLEIYRHIGNEYRTQSVPTIYEELAVSHPAWNLSQAQIGYIIKKMKQCFDKRITDCREKGRFQEAEKIQKLKHLLLPDKRSKCLETANEIVDEQIVKTFAAELLAAHPAMPEPAGLDESPSP